MNIDYKLLAEQKAHLVDVLHDSEMTEDQREALDGILHLLDALGDEAEGEVPIQSDTFEVRFRPQAWINDHAVDVDLDGRPNTWLIEQASESDVISAIDNGTDLDFLVEDHFAPKWVGEYVGPYQIELVDDPMPTFDQLVADRNKG
jgi:hypothetical protein